MATVTPSVALTAVKVLLSSTSIKIDAGAAGILTMDRKKVDAVWENLTTAEKNAMTPIVNYDIGVLTNDELSGADMKHIMSVRKKSNEYVAPSVPTATAPVVHPAVVQPTATAPETKPTAPAPGMVTSPIAQFPNHTVTIINPDSLPTVKAAAVAKKKRKKRGEKIGAFLMEDVTDFCRAYQFDALEARIAQLQAAKELLSGKVKRMTYDIPTPIRAEIIEPTKVFRCIGPMPTESEVIGREENFELEFFLSFLSILDSYKKGSENAKRLGCFAKYRISTIAFEDVNDLKEEVSDALDEKLIQAHTRLVNAIIGADAVLKEAMKDDNLTLNDQDKATCAWAKECRARIRAAHEELNVAIRHLENFDATEEAFDRIKGFEAATRSARQTFNTLAANRRVKGVNI